MQKYKCKLCSKSFSNGRALGGHMKSHLVSSSSSSLDGQALVYGLRENPRKSSRVFKPDPELYNSETETEPAPVRKRGRAVVLKKKRVSKKQKMSKSNSASSVSDGSPEQDLAMWLMMLSRDSREVELKKPIIAAAEEKELRRCVIDLNLPPPQESDVVTAI